MADDTVSRIRNRGHTRQIALNYAASALGVTARRIRALVYGEAYTIEPAEHLKLKAEYRRFLDEEARDLERRAAEARARIRELESQ